MTLLQANFTKEGIVGFVALTQQKLIVHSPPAETQASLSPHSPDSSLMSFHALVTPVAAGGKVVFC